MSLFDHYIAVDWSAHNQPKTGRDSIWIGACRADGGEPIPSLNPPTRAAAIAEIRRCCLAAIAAGERLLLGFDFAFGYPAGAAKLLFGATGWRAVWASLAASVSDSDANVSDRFAAAARLNQKVGPAGPHYWAHPWQHSYAGLTPRRPPGNHAAIAEKRRAEALNRKAQPVWKLYGNGAVGSQALLGIPRLEQLRTDPDLAPHIAIWPFDTCFAADLEKSIVIAEIFPSIVDVAATPGMVRDQLQVEAMAALFARADRDGDLATLLSAPAALAAVDRPKILAEEGWIVGVGHEALVKRLRSAA